MRLYVIYYVCTYMRRGKTVEKICFTIWFAFTLNWRLFIVELYSEDVHYFVFANVTP